MLSNDIDELMFHVIGRMRPREERINFEKQIHDMQEYKLAANSKSNDSDSLEKLLAVLADTYASNNQHFKLNDNNISIGHRCTRCASNATMMWEHTDIAFCGKHCANRKSAIGSLL